MAPIRKHSIALAVGLLFLVVLVYYVGRALSAPPAKCGPCGGSTPVCDETLGACVGCTADSQCAGGTLCNPSGACTLCRGDTEGCPAGTHCLNGTSCVECRPGSDADCAGSPGGPICSDGDVCVNCRSSLDCQDARLPSYSPSTPYCDVGANACVGCLGDQDCTGGEAYCAAGACAACDPSNSASCADGYCIEGSAGPACAPCVAGDGSRPCGDGTYCVDDGSGGAYCAECVDGDPSRGCPAGSECQGGQCRRACQTSDDCGAASSTPNCIGGLCVACSADADCSAADALYPVCENGLCVQCSVGADGAQTGCADPEAPHCYNSTCQQCSPSRGNLDCAGTATPFCAKVSPAGASDSYQCVECVSDTYCAGSSDRPWCDPATHSCAACDADHPCSSGLSCSGGLCQECSTDHDCPAGSGTYCAGGLCVQCRDSSECGPAAPWCSGGSCVACRGDADCAATPATPRCGPGGQACVACVDDLDCPTDPNRHCDVASGAYACVSCDAENPCPAETPHCVGGACYQCASSADCGGFPCVGGACGDCNTNCDCGDLGARYCDGGRCADLPKTCWSWKKWDLVPWMPADDAMRGPNYLAAVGRSTASSSWRFGETPRTQPGYGGLDYKELRGNKNGDTGKNYQTTLYPGDDGYYWYLAASPGCGRPVPLQSGEEPIRFDGSSSGVTSGMGVCATLSGDYVFSAPGGNGCGPPSNAGAFVFMSQRPHADGAC